MSSADDLASDADSKGAGVRMQLTQQLRECVTDGTFKPGDRLIERELCDRFGFSRASVREALRQLEAEGLIEIIPHRGPVVRTMTLDEMLELKHLQLSLECLVARRFVANGDEHDLALLSRRIDELEQAFVTRDRHRIKSAKLAYFEAFAAGAHSPTLRDYVRQVNARLSFLWASSLMVPGRSEESIGDMRMVLEMIRRRSAEAAEGAVVIHHERAHAVGMQGWHAFEQSQAPAGAGNRNKETRNGQRRSARHDVAAEDPRQGSGQELGEAGGHPLPRT